MTTTTKRLPSGLKKRLQANLENLTPKEAGRLLLIYLRELDKRKTTLGETYPPMEELWTALRQRVERSRGKPEEQETVDAYNAVVFLDRLIREVNWGETIGLSIALAFEAFKVVSLVMSLLRQDATTITARFVRSDIFDTPKPLSRDDYRRLLAWGADPNRLERLSEVAAAAAEDFDDFEAAYERIYADLVGELEAGELVGGTGFRHYPATWAPILIENGTIPAWVALRVLWKPYLSVEGYRVRERATFGDWAPTPVDQVFRPTGEPVGGDDLRKLARAFFKACRGRPWGKKLIAKPDPNALVKLLIQDASPFLHIDPSDFGRVDWEAFQANERNWGQRNPEGDLDPPFETEPVATVASLEAVVDWSLIESYEDEMTSGYYPTYHPDRKRESLARALAQLDRLETSRQPITLDLYKEEGELPLSAILGFSFLTPLEQSVEKLRDIQDRVAGVRLALSILSDRYFDGLPLLTPGSEVALKNAEEHLATARDALTAWADALHAWPFSVNTETIRIGEPEADEDFAAKMVELLEDAAFGKSRVSKTEVERALRRG